MNMLGLRDLFLIAQTPSLHHHHHHHHRQNQPISTENNNNSNLPLPSSAASLSVGFGIFPLLTATPCIPQPQNQNNDVQESSTPNNNNYWNLRMCPEVNNNTSPKKGVINFDNDEKVVVMGSESEENGIYGPNYRVCQDCGNRAKKDCVFRRCRTCCKGRGYHCNTHVKSTWIPSVRRREREVAAVSGGGGGGGDGGVKRPRSSQNVATTSHSSNSNATTSKNFATSSCHQDAGFKESLPGHVRAPAVFRCHRVTAIGNGEDEIAYLATVHISGHVFKGFLYDHGVGDKNSMPCVSKELQLGNNNFSGRKNGECSSSAIGINTNNNTAYPASAS